MVRTHLKTWQDHSVEAHHQAVMVHEYDGNERIRLVGRESVGRVDALDWLNKNQLAELKSHDRAALLRAMIEPGALSVSSFCQPESVKKGHPDTISETIACWSFRVLLTSLAKV